jgi:hypothetical protein
MSSVSTIAGAVLGVFDRHWDRYGLACPAAAVRNNILDRPERQESCEQAFGWTIPEIVVCAQRTL